LKKAGYTPQRYIEENANLSNRDAQVWLNHFYPKEVRNQMGHTPTKNHKVRIKFWKKSLLRQ
jgi:hypothetical protein